MCRAPNAAHGSKEHIDRLQRWSLRNRSWAQFSLAGLYSQGLGVNKDPQRACELWKLAANQGHHTAQYNLGYILHGPGRLFDASSTCYFPTQTTNTPQIMQNAPLR